MKSKLKLSQRALTNLLIGVTVGLVALYWPLFGAAPRGDAQALNQWAVWFAIYIGVIMGLVGIIGLLAVREARALLDRGHQERTKLLAELILSLPENRGESDEPPARS